MQKNTSVGWSSHCKFFWNALDPTFVIFFGKKNYLKKIQVLDLIGALIPYLKFFWKWNFFHFQEKITNAGSSAFQKNLQWLDQPTLVIFFAFLKKITTTGSSHFLSPNGQGFYHHFMLATWWVLTFFRIFKVLTYIFGTGSSKNVF